MLVRSDVEAAGVAVADEDVKFERLELPPVEEERDESRERQLGLIEPERRQERARGRACRTRRASPTASRPADEEEET